jgi:ribosomal protein S21
MPLKVKKKDKENNQSLVRRFSQKMKRSGILLEARGKQFKKRTKSNQLKKRAALRREDLKKKYKELKKMGKI